MRQLTACDVLLALSLVSVKARGLSAPRNNAREYETPSRCRDNEYFDTRLFTCAPCNRTRNLVASSDRLTCVCDEFSRTRGFERGFPLCVECDATTTVTPDGTDCIPCKNGSCDCPPGEMQIHRKANGALLSSITCLPCPKETFLSLDGFKCLPCKNSVDTIDARCACPMETHVIVNDRCFAKTDIAEWFVGRNVYLLKYDTGSIDSYYFRRELLSTLIECKKQYRVSCERLSNMCVLSLLANDAACILFTKAQPPAPLFYRDYEISSLLRNNEILQRYNLDAKSNNSVVNFTVAKFSLQGKFLTLDTPQIVCSLLADARFGVNVHKDCKITARELMSLKAEFFTPFLKFNYKGKDFLHALPVLIKNSYQEELQYTRKFFVVDNVSGYKAISGTSNDSFRKEPELSVLRYMKSLSIQINVQNGDDRGKIYPPLIVVEYGELAADDIAANVHVNINYKVTFVFDKSHTNIYIQISVAVFSALALIFATIKTWNYSKRNYKYTSYVTAISWFFVYGLGVIGNVLIFIVLSFSLYVFVLYKGQTVPHILLPDDSTEETIRICVILSACFKCVEVIGFMYQHWSIDIFLIDWEQPRNIQRQYEYDSPRTSLHKLYKDRMPDERSESAKTPSEIIAAKRIRTTNKLSKKDLKKKRPISVINEDIDSKSLSGMYMVAEYSSHDAESCSSKDLPVSIWRTYFIANEWLKLLEERRVNILLQMIYVLFILQVVGLENWCLATPDLLLTNEHHEIKVDITLRYGVLTLIYTTVYTLQWITSVAFYERYIRNRKEAFVDLCPVANISAFILAHNYYGYYIHGRSVHGFADTDLPTLINDLNKEQNDLCAHRGLVPGTTDQCFIVSTTQTFRIIYDEIVRKKDAAARTILKNGVNTSIDWKAMCCVRSEIKNFFCQFLDHCFKNEDYIIKEQHLIEKVFGVQGTYPKEKSIFYKDHNLSFDQVLLYGNEWLLGVFEITVFLLILTLYENCILSSGVTILISRLLTTITKWNGKRNLTSKSLLDERFLI